MDQKALIQRLRLEGIAHEGLLHIMQSVPRHVFVEASKRAQAYENIPLSIGYDQTISQPYIVARMTEALLAGKASLDRVLEIGTGSGYQAAILSQCAAEVYTMERIEPLYVRSRDVLHALNMSNVHVFYGDGGLGLPEYAPFDGIIITAALAVVPETLLSQLAIGGRLVAPVGRSGSQSLMLITRTATGFMSESIGSVRFVPFKKGVE